MRDVQCEAQPSSCDNAVCFTGLSALLISWWARGRAHDLGFRDRRGECCRAEDEACERVHCGCYEMYECRSIAESRGSCVEEKKITFFDVVWIQSSRARLISILHLLCRAYGTHNNQANLATSGDKTAGPRNKNVRKHRQLGNRVHGRQLLGGGRVMLRMDGGRRCLLQLYATRQLVM